MSKLVIATRESRLALWQAEHVKALLEQRGHQVSLLGMTTRGDQILDRVLSKVGGKGLFVKELEVALEEGRADIAVHSLKDVPMELPEGFALACVMEREDPRDAFVSSRVRRPGRIAARRGGGHLQPAPRGAAALAASRPEDRSRCAATWTRACASWTKASTTPSCWRRPASSGWVWRQRIRQRVRARADAAGRGPGRAGHRGARRPRRPAGAAGAAGAPGDLAGGRRRTRGEPRHGRQLLDAAGRHATFSGEYLQLRAAWGDPDGCDRLGAGARRPPSRPTSRRPANWATAVAARLRAAGAH